MIANYSPPQSTISQYLDTVIPGAANQRNALAVGAQYQVQRFVQGTTANSLGVAYNSAGLTLTPSADVVGNPFVADGVLDANYTQLFGQKLLLQATAAISGGSLHFAPDSLTNPQQVSLYTNSGNTTLGVLAGTGLNAAFQGRSVQVGDAMVFTDTSDTANVYSRVVTAVLGQPIAASVGTFANGVGNPVTEVSTTVVQVSATGPSSAATLGGSGSFTDVANRPTFNGYFGDQITVYPTIAGAQGVAVFSIRSASGLYSYDNVASSGSGTTFTLAQTVGGVTLSVDGVTSIALGSVWVANIEGGYTPLTATASGTYSGNVNTTYIIRVSKGGAAGTAQFSISDSAGQDTPVTITSPGTYSTPIVLGTLGVILTFTANPASEPQGGFALGDIYTIPAVAASRSTSVFTTVQLNGPAYDASWFPGATLTSNITLSTVVEASFTGYIAPQNAPDFVYNFTTGELVTNGVEVRANMKLPLTTDVGGILWAPVVTGTGLLFLTARALVPPVLGESYIQITSDADILNILGGSDQDNDLGLLANWVLAGGQGQAFYVLRVASEDTSGYTAALTKAENSDIFYSLVTTANAPAIWQELQAHVDFMSTNVEEQWRMCFLPVTSPGEYAVLQEDEHGQPALATVSTLNGQNVRLRDENALFTTLNLNAGDLVRLNYGTNGWGDTTFTEYPIAAVVSDQELTLATPTPTPISTPSAYQVWKAASAANTAYYLNALSNQINDRRVNLVWIDNPQILNTDGVTFGPQKVCAVAGEVAGIRAAAAPQQGLTRYTLSSVAQAPTMYTQFTKQLLNQIAADGVFIVTQSVAGGSIFIRHELTTATNNGPLYYENSVTSNLDAICYSIKAVVDQYTGKWNATPTTLALINNSVTNVLLTAANTSTNDQIGTQIISFDDTNGNQSRIYIAFSPTNADRFIIKVNIVVPLPLNGVDVFTYAQVYSASTGTVVAGTVPVSSTANIG